MIPNSVKPLYLIFNKINEYIEDRNTYLTLVPADGKQRYTEKILRTMG